jgi:DNA repair photolyase
MKKFKNRPEHWGYFLDVKINAPEVLSKQIKKIKPPKQVFMSSVCDSWQPLEAKYKLSRVCLKILLEAGLEVSILTKSNLILRDFDLLQDYKTPSLGMTITTLEKNLQKVLEPYASECDERISTLKKAQKKGIKTWVFLGPLLPEFTDTQANLKTIFSALNDLNLDKICIDRLNLRWGVLQSLKRGLARYDSANLKLLLYKCTNAASYSEYSQQLKQKTSDIATEFNLEDKLTFCF